MRPPKEVRAPEGPHATGEDRVTSIGATSPSPVLATQLRRRRAASYRLRPLPDGRQDPLDPKPGRRPLRVLSVTEDSTTGLALLRGVGSQQLATDLGLNPAWSESGRGWVVDAAHVSDLIALGEHLHYVVSWRERTT
jgi:hypothetical protein